MFDKDFNLKDKKIKVEIAKKIGNKLGLNWDKIDLNEFIIGLEVELEHGTKFPEYNVTDDDLTKTAKIALAHLKELPDYYTRLIKMENQGKKELKESKGFKNIFGFNINEL